MELPAIRHEQSGLFRVDQAGLTPHVLERLVRDEQLVRLRESVYVEPRSLCDLTDVQRHLLQLRADQLALPEAWAADRRSAALVHGLPLIGTKPPSSSQLTRDVGDGRTRPIDRHHRIARLPSEQLVVVDGILTVDLARTAVGVARQERFRNGVTVMDAVLGRGVAVEDVERVLKGMRRWPGVVAARAALRFANGLAESPLESLSRVAHHDLGLPAPELQVEVWDGAAFVARVDNLWRADNTVGEADGLAKFGDDPGDRERSFRRLKQQHDWLEELGLVVVRWGWDDAWRPGTGVLERRVRAGLERGRGRSISPSVRFVPTTVADRLRRDAARSQRDAA